jgi:hypothetical protein
MKTPTINSRLRELGISEIKPTAEALKEMEMSKRRLTTILDRKNKTQVTVSELQSISKWLNKTTKIGDDDLVEMVR